MDFNNPKERLINGNINPLSSEQESFSSCNHDDDSSDSRFSDFEQDNSLNTAVQEPASDDLVLDLKAEIDILEAQNYQYRRLLRQQTGKQLKQKEQIRKLLNQIEAHQKMKNAIETLSTQLAQKENDHKEMERENRRLFQVLSQVAGILSKVGQEETDNSSPSKSSIEGHNSSNEKPFQFINNKTSSFQKEHVAPFTVTISSKENSEMSDNQILQVTKTPSSSTPKKNQFCHQQSEGFKIPTEQLHNASNLNPEDSEICVINITFGYSPNRINLNVERVSDKELNLNFAFPCAAHFKFHLDNWRVSHYLENNQNSSPKNSSSLPSETCLTNKQKDNVSSQPVDEGPCKKKPKVLY